MQTTHKTSLELVHRLLFQALVEIREQGRLAKNSPTFHLADLFHNAVLDMQSAAEHEMSYDEVLSALQGKARENGCLDWLNAAVQRLDD